MQAQFIVHVGINEIHKSVNKFDVLCEETLCHDILGCGCLFHKNNMQAHPHDLSTITIIRPFKHNMRR